jgi:hypothetical protein
MIDRKGDLFSFGLERRPPCLVLLPRLESDEVKGGRKYETSVGGTRRHS